MTTLLISVLVLGWLLAATIGTYAYFANEQNPK
ncbi:endonuclease [Myxosarcina sp. GI1]